MVIKWERCDLNEEGTYQIEEARILEITTLLVINRQTHGRFLLSGYLNTKSNLKF